MHKVLVTGGAGFIGSNLIRLLLKEECSVVVLDNLSSGKMENLQGIKNNHNFKFIHGDVREAKTVKHALLGVATVVHLAALIDVSASVADPILTHEINVTGTLNLLIEAARQNVDKFVFASSTAVYGDAKNLPVREETPCQPISPYAASKAAAEAYCSAYAGCCGLDTVRLRFFNVYGPKNENSIYSGVITKFISKAQQNETLTIEGDGEQTRDFIHVSDVVHALAQALEGKGTRGDVFNVCTGRPISINDLVNTLSDVTGRNLKTAYVQPRTGDIRASYGDPSKAALKLGFKARISLAEGLKHLIEESKI
jgi:nucleoside-diphosphate-sugar epimerase